MKKKLTEIKPELNTSNVQSTVSSTSNVQYEFKPLYIELLTLNLDLGREDLNQNAKKVEDKINEIIKKVN